MLEFLQPSRREVLTRAVSVLRAQASGRRAPVVLWQGLQESAADFDERMIRARGQIPDDLVLIAVSRPHPQPLPGVRLVELAPKLFELLHPSAPARYRVASGGRGSAKSHSFATGLVLRAITRPTRVLCCREIQRSIRESVHRLLSDRIEALGLSPWFDVREHSISAVNGSEAIFEGLFANISKIKSLEGVDIAYLEEAEAVTDRSLEVLIPTIRTPGSEIWLSLNPDATDDPVYSRFIAASPPHCRHVHVTYNDNPWFPIELERERAYLQSVDDDAYRHVWLGECRKASDAQIFRGKFVSESFEPQPTWSGPYLGAHFGFSQDPTTLVRCWIDETARELYIEHEAYGIGVDIDKLPELFDSVPDARKRAVRADCARPETISYLQKHGYPWLTGVEKWSGSVEDGIAYLRQFARIIVHPRCSHTLEELRLYSYKVDRLTGDVLADVIDKFNHCIDALRYALQPLIRNRHSGFLTFMQLEVEAMKARRAGQGVTP
jgi:phage terminase large subunit